MSSEIKRKKGETFEAMLRRFNKRIIQSGKIIEAKKSRYRSKDPNRNLQKRSALYKKKVRAEKEYLSKTGQLKEEDKKYFRK